MEGIQRGGHCDSVFDRRLIYQLEAIAQNTPKRIPGQLLKCPSLGRFQPSDADSAAARFRKSLLAPRAGVVETRLLHLPTGPVLIPGPVVVMPDLA